MHSYDSILINKRCFQTDTNTLSTILYRGVWHKLNSLRDLSLLPSYLILLKAHFPSICDTRSLFNHLLYVFMYVCKNWPCGKCLIHFHKCDKINIFNYVKFAENAFVKVWRSWRGFVQGETPSCTRAFWGWAACPTVSWHLLYLCAASRTNSTESRPQEGVQSFTACCISFCLSPAFVSSQASEQIYYGNTEGGYYTRTVL